jgi:hypothetical protein
MSAYGRLPVSVRSVTASPTDCDVCDGCDARPIRPGGAPEGRSPRFGTVERAPLRDPDITHGRIVELLKIANQLSSIKKRSQDFLALDFFASRPHYHLMMIRWNIHARMSRSP